MKFMLLIYHDEKQWSEITQAERETIYAEYRGLRQELQTAGQFVDGSELKPVSSAKSVRVRNGRDTVTDGPFAETKEQLGGYFLIDVANDSQAVAIARRIPSARTGAVEIRRLAD